MFLNFECAIEFGWESDFDMVLRNVLDELHTGCEDISYLHW